MSAIDTSDPTATTPGPVPETVGDLPGTFIAGSWLSRDGAIPVVDPATGESFGRVLTSEVDDVEAAVSAASAAAGAWARTSPSERGAILGRWADLVFQHMDRLATLESRNVGKPLSGGRLNVLIAGSLLRYYAGGADKQTGVTLPVRDPGYFGYTQREPYGVCAIVLPWNVPALLCAANVAPALAAGNTVVLKPSEVAPLVVRALVELGIEAGLPDGVLNMLTAAGAEVPSALVGHPGVDHVSFVGSVATGRLVMEAAARNLTPVKLELGGKSPNIVFADARLDVAVPAVVHAITENAGQNCNAGSRLLVEASIADEVRARVVEQMAAVRVGAWNEDLDMGPLVNRTQLERVTGIVDAAVSDGSELLLGGVAVADRQVGNFMAPTVLAPAPGAPVIRQEIFGPVLTIETFTDEAAAVALANGTDFGLLTSIWTQDVSRAHRLTAAVQAGQVTVNQHADGGVIGMPFNMYNQSGFSSGSGYGAMHEFTREKAVAFKLLD